MLVIGGWAIASPHFAYFDQSKAKLGAEAMPHSPHARTPTPKPQPHTLNPKLFPKP